MFRPLLPSLEEFPDAAEAKLDVNGEGIFVRGIMAARREVFEVAVVDCRELFFEQEIGE